MIDMSVILGPEEDKRFIESLHCCINRFEQTGNRVLCIKLPMPLFECYELIACQPAQLVHPSMQLWFTHKDRRTAGKRPMLILPKQG